MDEQQKKLLTHMALLAAFGGGSGAMMGSGSGAVMGGLSLPLLYMLLQRSGTLGGRVPGSPATPMSTSAGPPIAFNQPKHRFMDDFRRQANLISTASAPTKVFGQHANPAVQNMIMQGRAARFNRWAQDQVIKAPERYDNNNAWTAKLPTTQVGQNAKAVEDVADVASYAPFAGLPLMAFPGKAGALGRTLWGRTFMPIAAAGDTAKTIRNVAEHGWEGAALSSADATRRALMRAPLMRYGSAADGGEPFSAFSRDILMSPFKPVSNLQTIAGGIGAMTDSTGRDYVTPFWYNQRTYRPERQVATQLEAQRKKLVDGLYARGAPMDAVRQASPPAPTLSSLTSDTGTEGSLPRPDQLQGDYVPPRSPRPLDLPATSLQKSPDGRSLKDRGAHPNPDGASLRHYMFGGR